MQDDTITLFYCPRTRATGTRFLLEELGLPYRLHVMNMPAGENRQPAYLAVNPLGKVPAIHHHGTLVTEQAAVLLYLSELAADRGLTPMPGDPDRGAFLRWAVFYNACFEPALIDRIPGRDAPPPTQSAYGTYEDVIGLLRQTLSAGPWLLGNRMTTLDFLWGIALTWTIRFGLVPDEPVFADYVARIAGRPAFRKVSAEDEQIVARQEAEASRVA